MKRTVDPKNIKVMAESDQNAASHFTTVKIFPPFNRLRKIIIKSNENIIIILMTGIV